MNFDQDQRGGGTNTNVRPGPHSPAQRKNRQLLVPSQTTPRAIKCLPGCHERRAKRAESRKFTASL